MFERVGGVPFFEELTQRFYALVADDVVLAPLYPVGDAARFEEARRHLCSFLVQYWGGPATYSEERGAPQLRMRHAPFAVGPAERDAWVRHMTAAVRAARLTPLDETQMVGSLTGAANALVNRPAS